MTEYYFNMSADMDLPCFSGLISFECCCAYSNDGENLND